MVKKRYLFLIACIVWLIAGLNVTKIGFICFQNNLTIINIILSCLIFILFDRFIFSKLVKKHHQRIKQLEGTHHYFYQFFDLKSFLIMAFMMSFGIIIRNKALLDEKTIAIYYSGLGLALTLAGIRFGLIYGKEG